MRPVSILTTFSKIDKLLIKTEIVIGTGKYLSPLVWDYRKGSRTQHVITKLIEDWRETLDQTFTVGVVLTDLAKTFERIPHDLLSAKLETYGFTIDTLALVFSYLNNRKQSVRVKNVHINFKTIISNFNS